MDGYLASSAVKDGRQDFCKSEVDGRDGDAGSGRVRDTKVQMNGQAALRPTRTSLAWRWPGLGSRYSLIPVVLMLKNVKIVASLRFVVIILSVLDQNISYGTRDMRLCRLGTGFSLLASRNEPAHSCRCAGCALNVSNMVGLKFKNPSAFYA